MITSILVSSILFSINLSVVRAEPRTLIVDADGSADFSTIQGALDDAISGDTILVRSGTYPESVDISKSSITLQGQDRETTIINDVWGSDISDFTFSGFTTSEVVIEGYSVNVRIENNIIKGNYDLFHDNDAYTGIKIFGDSNNITDNIVIGIEGYYPVYLFDGFYMGVGIFGDSNIIMNNTILGANFFGYIRITFPVLRIYNYMGVGIFGDSNNVTDNKILNTFVALGIDGIDNLVDNNEFVNKIQSVDVIFGSDVTWNLDSNGNYWSDYIGIDENQDGIGDSPYIIDENNQDNYPLMEMSVPDLDNDGIYNDIDSCPLDFSSDSFPDFSERINGRGFMEGVLVTMGDQIVTIKDEPSPYGVRIICDPSGGDIPAWIGTTIGNYSLESGTDIVLTAGSQHVKVNQGITDCELPMPDGSKLTITLVTGDEIAFEETTFELANNGQNTIVPSAFGEEFIIEPGTRISFIPSVEFNPDTLNLQSNGKWITAYIEPSPIYDVNDIDQDSIMLEGFIVRDKTAATSIGDYDNDGFSDLMIKFLSADLISSLYGVIDYQSETGRASEVTFTISGSYTNGEGFSCSDTIRVLSSKK